jgi:four helix bundle protein
MQDCHQLDIWQRAMDYAVKIYAFAAELPPDERHNLVAQLRKAAVSVPMNIAEGTGCTPNPEFARFLGYAYRSRKELVTCLERCERLYPSVASAHRGGLIDEGNQISRMPHNFMPRLGPAGEPPL